MVPLFFLLGTFVLLGGFLGLSSYETRQGTRVWAGKRAHFDTQVERAEFILTHIDLAAFLREEFQHIAKRVAHDIAHFSLQAVRTIERFLTRLVRHLRMERTIDATPHENAREFIKTLSDFKTQLNETPPEIPDIY